MTEQEKANAEICVKIAAEKAIAELQLDQGYRPAYNDGRVSAYAHILSMLAPRMPPTPTNENLWLDE